MAMRRIWWGLLLVGMLGLAGAGQGQLAQNGQTTFAANWTPGSTRTVAHTTPVLQNRLLIVAVHMNVQAATGGTPSVQTITYGGTPLTFGAAEDSPSPLVRTEVWFLLNPATGSNSTAVTLQGFTGGSVEGVIGVSTYVDVDQNIGGTIGYSTNNTSATPSNALAGTTAGQLVVDFISVDQNAGGTVTGAVGALQTSIYNVNSPAALNTNDVLAIGSYEPSPAGGTITMSYNLNASREWAAIGGALSPATTDVAITGVALPDVIDVGANNITFTFTITAATTAAGANNINFADTLPAGLSIVSATPSQGTCTPGTTTNCNLGNLAPGASATVTLVASTTGGTPGVIYNNSASISVGTTDAVAGNNSATVSVRTQGQLCATPGKDGAGGTLTGTINTYFPGTANAAAGATSITVGAVPAGYGTTGITAGDLLLVIQMQDAAIDSNNDERYGDGTGVPGAVGSAGSGSSNFNNAGRYEYVVATNAVTTAGGTINITGAGSGNGLIYAYTTANATGTQGQRRFQVIRVPQYTTATIARGINVPAWQSNATAATSVGGVFVIDALGTVTMGTSTGTGTVATTAASQVLTGTGTAFLTEIRSGDTINVTGETARTVVRVVSNTQLWVSTAFATTGTGRTFTVPTLSVSAIGFRGGAGRQLAGGTGANTDYRTLATNAVNGSKGEGFAGTPRYIYNNSATVLDTGTDGYPNGSYARGAPGNAGGGGSDGETVSNQMNTGGGGGANGGSGGNGGNAWNNNAAVGGFGGAFGAASTTRLTLGGGGGAGTTNNATQSVPAGTPAMGAGIASSGAWGGGMIIIRANTISGTGTLAANGGWALDVLNDSGGGGGAGGTIVINALYGTLTGLTIQARGGRGGNAWLTMNSPCSVGPCPPNPRDFPGERHGPGGGGGGGAVYLSSTPASVDVSGGVNGLTTTDLDNFGANPGLPGISSTPLGVMAGAGATYGCAVCDLAVTNTDTPDPVTPGSNITYTQTLTNNGPNAADQPVFTTSVPASATFQSITPPPGWTCITPAVGGTGLITCSPSSPIFASGASVNFSLVVQAHPGTPAGYIMSNTASASSQTKDSNAANDSATTTTEVVKTGFADLSVVITDSPDPVVANTNISYTQTVRNLGGSTAVNPTFTETVPANCTFQGITPPAGWTCITPAIGGTGTISCSAASMVAGASLSFPLQVRVNAGTPSGTIITETATVSSTTPDSNTANNSSSTTTTVVGAGTADLAVTVDASPDPVVPGGLVTFNETVTNNGPATSSNVSFTQQTPVGTTFESIVVPAGWTCGTLPPVGGTGTITCTRASFPIGTVSSFPIVFRVNGTTATGTTLTLPGAGAVVSATTTDPIAANNSANDSVLVASPTSADVAIDKSDSPDPVGHGQLITYVLRVTNNGPAVATGVVASDTLPASVNFERVATSQGSCSTPAVGSTGTITCTLGTLNIGNVATISIVGQATATGTITNNCSVTTTSTDPVASNNSDSEPTTVLAVTLVRLRNFTATRTNAGVHILWQTDFEADNLGFNVYREAGGVRTKLNKNIIAGSALVSRRDPRADYVYRYTDPQPTADAQYWVEDIDLRGTKSLHGAITPSGYAESSFTPQSDSLPIEALDDDPAILESAAGYGVIPNLELTWGAPESTQQFQLAGMTALKIYVSAEGWQRVTRASMVSAGFNPGTDGNLLSLFAVGTECAIVIDNGSNALFDEPTDAIEFYGLPMDTASTGSRTYWLVLNTGNHDRVATSPTTGGAPLANSVAFEHQRMERTIWFPSATSNGDGQNFFGPIVTSTPSTQDLALGSVDTSYGGNATLTITIQGGTDVAHSIEVSMNGHVVGTPSLTNTQYATFEYPFPHSWLVSGTNTLSIRALGGDDDVSGVAYTRVDYHHTLTSQNGAFLASLPSGQSVTVAGFAAGVVRAVDITDATHPIELAVSVDGSGNATFTPTGADARKVLVFHASRVIAPATMVTNTPSTWNLGTNEADLVIISHADFASAAATLEPVREAQGFETSVIDVEDLYDEFNFGIRDPRAIRAFLQSSGTWQTPPHYALLVGDASFDARNYLAMGNFDYLPVKLVVTTGLKTASDDWYGDFNDDGVSDFAIGRIPVRTAAEATRIFGRLTSRGVPSGAWSNRALFVSDAPTDYDFPAASDSLIALLPGSMNAQHIHVENNPSASSEIVSGFNDGQLLVNYIGHGSTEIWGGNIFDTTAALALTNGSQLPFAVIMNCLNGYFHDLFTHSLGEGLMTAENGGAIAVWASSSLTQPDQQAIMNRELYRMLFQSHLPIGEAVRRAKIAATDNDVRKSWNLFGDPTMYLTAPPVINPVTMSTVSANPTSITANGVSTSTITVQAKDDNGNNITTGGATVTLSTDLGNLSSVTDHSNGTYTATLTSSMTAGTATISGTFNGLPLANSALVTFAPGPAASFLVSAPASVTAGDFFTVTVTARDANGNTATGYTGTLHFTSTDPSAVLPSDYTLVEADAGVVTFNEAVSLRTSGSRSITVRDASNASITGSASVTVALAPTITTVTSSPNASAPGETVTLTAHVASNAAGTITGTVTFRDGVTVLGSSPLSGGDATLNTSSLSLGSHSITAAYGGDATYAASTSDAHNHVVAVPPLGIPVITATATSTSSISIAWSATSGATGYDVFRSVNHGPFSMISQPSSPGYSDNTLAANTTYVYKVRGRDGSGNLGELSAPDLATTILFTDDPIVAGVTPLKAVHILELRTAVNAVRAAAGLSAATFTDPTLTGVAIKGIHITELRAALNPARSTIGVSTIQYTDPTLTAGTTRIKRAHVTELRDGVK